MTLPLYIRALPAQTAPQMPDAVQSARVKFQSLELTALGIFNP